MKNQSQALYHPLKSVAGALLFTVFLGPIGLLYASSMGGITMIILGLIVVSAKFPIPIILVWIGSSIWGVIAANRYNKKCIIINKETRLHAKANPAQTANY